MRLKRLVFIVIYVIFLMFLMEIWARAYYTVSRDMPFFSSARDQVYMWYPELKQLKEYDYQDGELNVLLLGGSALTEEWGNVPGALKEKVKGALGKEVNMVNLAVPAHSTLDSLYKYGRTENDKFDLVLLYHGINEVRANNVPPQLWKDDYSHYSWYDEVNFYFRHGWLRRLWVVFPYFLKHLAVQLDREVINRDKHVPTHFSDTEKWLEYGQDIKTAESFRANLLEIYRKAGEKGETLFVTTYAYYIPEGIEDDPESPYARSIRLWGEPANVVAGVDAHNDVIRGLSSGGVIPDMMFMDQQALLGGKKKYFDDVCHYSMEGSDAFAGNVAGRLKDDKF